jgi:hypothetical protein
MARVSHRLLGSFVRSGRPGLGHGPSQLPGLLGAQRNADVTRQRRAGVEPLLDYRNGYEYGVDQHRQTVTDVVRGHVGHPPSSRLRQPDLEDKPSSTHRLCSLDPGDVGIGKLGRRVEIHGITLTVDRGRNEFGGRRTLGQTQLDRNGDPLPIGGLDLLTRRRAGPAHNHSDTEGDDDVVAQGFLSLTDPRGGDAASGPPRPPRLRVRSSRLPWSRSSERLPWCRRDRSRRPPDARSTSGTPPGYC